MPAIHNHFNIELNHRTIISCIFAKNKLFVLYEVVIKTQELWYDPFEESIRWEVHMFDCEGCYSGLFCHGERDLVAIRELFMTADLNGHVFVSSSEHNKVYKFSPRGLLMCVFNVHHPLDIVVSSDDELFVISNFIEIQVFKSNGQLKRPIDIRTQSFSILTLIMIQVTTTTDHLWFQISFKSKFLN